MPFSFSVHDDHNFLWKRLYGDATEEDIAHLNCAVAAARESRARHGLVSDLRDLDSLDLGFSSMASVKDDMQTAYSGARRLRYAIFAPSDLAFAMARMYQTMMIGFEPLEIGVFRCIEETADFHGLCEAARQMLRTGRHDAELTA